MGDLFAALIWIGSVGGGLIFIFGAARWIKGQIRKNSREKSLKLQYGFVQTVFHVKNNTICEVSVRVILDNPQDESIYIEPTSLLTTFDGHTSNVPSSQLPRKEVGALSRNIVVHGWPVKIVDFEKKPIVEGRIDWVIQYGPKKESEDVKLRKTLRISGAVNIHQFRHGPENQWIPDDGIDHPVISEEQIAFVKSSQIGTQIGVTGARGPVFPD